MKLIRHNHIEISYANAKALVEEYERNVAQGRTPSAMIYKGTSEGTIVVSVVPNEVHYSESELSDRKSPYLAPEAWAGVL